LANNPLLFHWLLAIASDVSDHVGTDQEGYQDWYLTIKKEFTKKATKAVAAEVDEKWLLWKANQIDRITNDYKWEIANHARSKGIDYFIETGQRLRLHITRGPNAPVSMPTPTLGKKCSFSGSLPTAGPTTPTIRRIIPPSGHTPSPVTTPHGQPALPHSGKKVKTPPPNPKVAPMQPAVTNGGLNLDTIMAVIKATVGPAIQSAMAPYVTH
jgi:hypothetical protein